MNNFVKIYNLKEICKVLIKKIIENLATSVVREIR